MNSNLENIQILGNLLRKIIISNVEWHKSSQFLVKKAYARMQIVHKIAEFGAPPEDLIQIYISYVRSILEQSCVIWHSSLTDEDSELLEGVKKGALKVF